MELDTVDELSDADREEIGRLADLIVPGGDDGPSASDVGVQTRYIDLALRARPDLIESLDRALDAVRKGEGLRSLDSDVLSQVVELVVACYFMSPVARRSIEYSGQRPMPIAEGESEYYLEEDDILAPVIARGQTWRHVPR